MDKERDDEMDKAVQFGRGMMGLASYLPNYRADSYCCNPVHARMHGQGTVTCQEKVYGVDVRKEALGQGTVPFTALLVL